MFINTSLIDHNPYETTSSYLEDETIQLINYYGRQLIEQLDEDKNKKHRVRDIKDQMVSQHVKVEQPSLNVDIAPVKPAITQPILTFQKTVEIPIPQSIDLSQEETKRKYQIEKIKLSETVNRVQNRIAKPGYKDPYPIAQKQYLKKTSPMKRVRQSTTFVTEEKMQMPYGKPNEVRDRRLNKQFEAIREELNLKQNKEPKLAVEQKQQRLNDFMTRMEMDRRKRVEKSAKNAIEQMIKQSQEKTPERYRSTTPTSASKVPIRDKINRQKRKLEEQFARTSFSPDLVGLNPKFSRYYVQKSPENKETVQAPRRVIRLSNPQELQFLLRPTS